MASERIPVGILGATGVVGQRLIQRLERHPWFEVVWLAASDRSAGQAYAQAANWRLATPIPEGIAKMNVSPATPEGAPKLIFASLDSKIALELEPRFADAGCAVVSNSSAFRMQADVPLVIPEVNADHLKLLECQAWRRNSGGFIVTNPNCSATGLTMALAPLERAFGVEQVFVVTMQAVSGAGYPGVASLDIVDNVIPYIGSEEEKMETEPQKMLGRLAGSKIEPASLRLSAHCNRVPVVDGHTESVSIKLRKPASQDQIVAAWREFSGAPQELKLPSAPLHAVEYLNQRDRPQPRLDRDLGDGMTTSVGRLRRCGLLDWKFTCLSHNTVRGAAGATILNAEMLKAKGYLG
ncbi:MAG TPA: aspartate-semialdehyde dehydrogenase [Terriglobales bacterium]|nr:aspartate-semialdehyde dehydrogenase [Terriglobales bacterium]